MPEKQTLHPVYIHTISVNGDILQACGTADDLQLFPRQPIAFEITYEDFQVKEDFQTVLRILTDVTRQKVQKKIDAKEITLE